MPPQFRPQSLSHLSNGLSSVSVASALKCHQCSSFTDAKCADPFVDEPTNEGDEARPKTYEFLKDCPDDGKNYTICRKIYQYGE